MNRKFFMWLLTLTGMATLSCHTYYKAESLFPGEGSAIMLDSLHMQNRYFVLRSNGQAFHLKNLALSNDHKTLSATLDSLSNQHMLHLVNGRGGNMRYHASDVLDAGVLSEVHLYVPTLNGSLGEIINLSLDQVQKIEVIEKDKKRTTNSYVIGAIGYTLGAMAVATIIIAATKSSCPFVSAYDGNQFVLQGEIYGGAIYPQLARHDYLPLKMAPMTDGTLQLKISNELQEKQYTDFANLLRVKHAPGAEVLADEEGNLYSVSAPQAPLFAQLGNGKDVLGALQKRDDDAVAYMDDTTTTDAGNVLLLRFRQPNTSKSKLVLRLKNSYWLDDLYGELAKGFGSYYETYLKKQRKQPAEKLKQWTREQQIPLTVAVKKKTGWEGCAELTTTGPLAFRNVVVPIDLAGCDEDSLTFRLSSGLLFWELDYAAIDVSNEVLETEELQPTMAIDEKGNNVLPALQREDGTYLEQPQIGNVVTLAYKPTVSASTDQYTYLLHTKGHYQHIRHFTNKPDIGFLQQFRKPNAFPLYGKLRHRSLMESTQQLFASIK